MATDSTTPQPHGSGSGGIEYSELQCLHCGSLVMLFGDDPGDCRECGGTDFMPPTDVASLAQRGLDTFDTSATHDHLEPRRTVGSMMLLMGSVFAAFLAGGVGASSTFVTESPAGNIVISQPGTAFWVSGGVLFTAVILGFLATVLAQQRRGHP